MDIKKVQEIERYIIEEKPWQLRGEVGGRERPINGLLYENFQFKKDIKAPQITTEKTENLEEIIKQRVRDNQFDDPVRKLKPVQTAAKHVEVSSEKSKLGLAKVYEQQVLPAEKAAKEGEVKEIEKKLGALLKKLDAL